MTISSGNGHGPAPRVLIVDDDPEIRHVLKLLFEFERFEIVGEADDGLSAIPLALEHQPDFIILDYRMPRMDGAKAAEILREASSKSRIVAFSSVLFERPKWADAYLNKDRISEIAPLLGRLLTAPRVAS
ncbi:MAG: response regulator [Actinomycetota bacterium]|nr:response regulator [Actinomycetota bacterium]